MGQTYTSTNPVSGTTIFGDLYQIIRDHFDACATLFVGGSAPSSPSEGRPWYDSTNDMLKVYDGSIWRGADYNTDTYDEVVNARGAHTSFGARIDVSINADGTISGATPAGAWWTSAATTSWGYKSSVQFHIQGDKRAVYTVGRAMKFGGVTGNPQYSYVTANSYAGTSTTVTIKDAILGASMTTPQHGQELENFHRGMPWTRGLTSNSATSRDLAPVNFALLADGSGGVTVKAVVALSTVLDDQKKWGLI